MPFTVEEYIPNKVILAEIDGEVTWEDFEGSRDAQLQLMNNT